MVTEELQQDSPKVRRLKELAELIDNGDQVQEMLNTRGWSEIISPLIDKMIKDIVGGKENGRWHNGSLSDQRLGEARMQVLESYKRALVNVLEHIYSYVDDYESWRKEYEFLVKEEQSPTVQESEYVPQEES